MREYETRNEPVEYLESCSCDKCGKDISHDFDLQEALCLKFTGGYSSVFGDGVTVEADICQDCLKVMIGDFCRYSCI